MSKPQTVNLQAADGTPNGTAALPSPYVLNDPAHPRFPDDEPRLLSCDGCLFIKQSGSAVGFGPPVQAVYIEITPVYANRLT